MEIYKVGEFGCNFDEVANGDWMVNSQAVSFNKDTFFLKPSKKVIVRTVEFDVSNAVVAKHIASNANMHLVLFLDPKGQHFEELLEFAFACWNQC